MLDVGLSRRRLWVNEPIEAPRADEKAAAQAHTRNARGPAVVEELVCHSIGKRLADAQNVGRLLHGHERAAVPRCLSLEAPTLDQPGPPSLLSDAPNGQRSRAADESARCRRLRSDDFTERTIEHSTDGQRSAGIRRLHEVRVDVQRGR